MAAEAVESSDILESAVKETSSYFTSIVELIPAKYYIENELEGDYKNVPYSGGKKKKFKALNKKLLTKKAKLLKLDPVKHKTVAELQLEVEKKEQEFFSDSNNITQMKTVNVSNIPSTSLEELREKLHEKVTQLRGKRKELHGDEKIQAKKCRLEKKESSDKKKKKQTQSDKIKNVNEIDKKFSGKKYNEIKNDNGKVVFSKFDFAVGVGECKNKKKKKKKDITVLLEKAEKTQDKIKLLQETDVEKAKEFKKKIAWESAVRKAEGVKLKDDPKLLRKSIKKRNKLKEKSVKKWKERTDTVEKQKDEKQKLRKQHLKERRDEKGVKKKGKKKTRPGF